VQIQPRFPVQLTVDLKEKEKEKANQIKLIKSTPFFMVQRY